MTKLHPNLRSSLKTLCFIIFFPSSFVFAGEPGADSSSIAVLRLNEAADGKIEIDGLLSEDAWQRAEIASGFRQIEPYEGKPATEDTEVRVLVNDNTLFIGILAKDRAPEKIISRILQRDKIMEGHIFTGAPLFAGDDAVAILLDPFHDHRNAMVFAANPNGAEFDALLTDEGREFNIDWRAVWRVAAKRIPEGWSAEFAIPFRTLRYPPNASGQPWGLNIYRMTRRKNEETLWRAWSKTDNEGFARVSKAGHLRGMKDLPRSGLNLEVKPFTLAGASQEFPDSGATDNDSRLSAGFDAKWEVRPGLALDLTLNTDFAQVEVDDQQVNLTRFELFFPEKRDFFLENAGIFNFGLKTPFEPPAFLMFFSRRIGIADDGLVPVIGGARLTGRVGKQTVGFMNVLTEAEFDDPRTNFAIARVKRDIGGRNYLGFMAADRRSHEMYNTNAGVDATFWLNNTLNFQGFAARSMTQNQPSGTAYRVALDQTKRFWGMNLQHVMISEDVRTDMGFTLRTDLRRSGAFARLSPRPEVLGLRVITIFAGGQYMTTLNGDLLDWNSGPFVSLDWESGENLSLFYSTGETVVSDAFDIADRALVPADRYDLTFLGAGFNTSRGRSAVLGLNGLLQKNWGGELLNLGANLSAAFGSRLNLQLGYSHNRVDLPNGGFNADVGGLRLSYAFSTTLFANLLVQYNSLDNSLNSNFRLNFIHRPGSDLFLVLNDNRGTEQSLRDRQLRDVILKVTYLYRL